MSAIAMKRSSKKRKPAVQEDVDDTKRVVVELGVEHNIHCKCINRIPDTITISFKDRETYVANREEKFATITEPIRAWLSNNHGHGKREFEVKITERESYSAKKPEVYWDGGKLVPASTWVVMRRDAHEGDMNVVCIEVTKKSVIIVDIQDPDERSRYRIFRVPVKGLAGDVLVDNDVRLVLRSAQRNNKGRVFTGATWYAIAHMFGLSDSCPDPESIEMSMLETSSEYAAAKRIMKNSIWGHRFMPFALNAPGTTLTKCISYDSTTPIHHYRLDYHK